MTHPIIHGLYRVTVQQAVDGKAMANVIFVMETGVDNDELNVGRAVQTAWSGSTSIAAVQSTAWQYTGTSTQCWGTLNEAVTDTWQPTQKNGRQAGTMAPPNVAFVHTLRTGLAGRANRGRIYIGGVIQGNMTTNNESWNLSGTHMSDCVNNFMSSLLAGTPSVALYVFSRSQGIALASLSTSRARAGLGTQRKRSRRFATP